MPLTAEAAVRRTAGLASRSAFFFDFDGTVAPIADDPDSVQPVPGIIDTLGELSRTAGSVAIVSARPVDFLQRRFSCLPDVTLFGLYGLESLRGDGPVETDAEAAPYLDAMADLAKRAQADLPSGVRVEYKRLAVALHYREAPMFREEVEQWSRTQAQEYGLRLQGGRMVVELKPPGDRDKGSVVREETEGRTCGWYFGDDLSDLKGFAALDERQASDPGFVGVRVAVANPETGHEVTEAADLRIDGPTAVPPLIEQLLAAI